MQASKETIIVVFGGTGDLMQNKIAPSLYYLLSKSDSKNTKILGCGRSECNNETYKSFLKVGIDKKLNIDAEENILGSFNYLQGDLNETIFYENLNNYLQSEKLKFNELNVVIYFSVMPELFSLIIPKLKSNVRIDNPKLIIEKPFGYSEGSARNLDKLLLENYSTEQIFRVEHYLAKNILQYIPKFRFGPEQGKYEKFFNNQFVERIEVDILETLDVDKRGKFYDSVGALRDVGQNHCLQILALLCCENIGNLSQAKKEFFENNLDFDPSPFEGGVRGGYIKRFQYEGFKDLDGVKENSETETAFSITTVLKSEKWKGVEVVLRAGKAFKDKKKQAEVYFKKNLAEYESGKYLHTIKFVLDEDLEEVCVTDKNGSGICELKEIERENKIQYVTEYAKIFEFAESGKQDIFVGSGEIYLMWKFVDKYLKAFRDNKVELQIYKKFELNL